MSENLFEYRGGIRLSNSILGELNITYPFVTLCVKERNLTLKWNFIFFRKEYSLRYDEIIGVKVRKGIISTGIEFVHNNNQLPNLIIFWTQRCDEVLDILEEKGIKRI